jgi:effector-binding domain-containing protein
MIDTPQITESVEQLIAFIHLTVPRTEIRTVMGPGLTEVHAAIAAQGIAAAGPWFTHHLRMDPAVFDFEICVPVAMGVNATGRVRPGRLPATRVARTVYRGGYERLGAAWGEFDAWITANQLTPAPDLWEVYLAGPESSPDPADWRTELNRPLMSSGNNAR